MEPQAGRWDPLGFRIAAGLPVVPLARDSFRLPASDNGQYVNFDSASRMAFSVERATSDGESAMGCGLAFRCRPTSQPSDAPSG